MKPSLRLVTIVVCVLFAVYVCSYLWFRSTRSILIGTPGNQIRLVRFVSSVDGERSLLGRIYVPAMWFDHRISGTPAMELWSGIASPSVIRQTAP